MVKVSRHVAQADKGCGVDVPRRDFSGPTPEPEINR